MHPISLADLLRSVEGRAAPRNKPQTVDVIARVLTDLLPEIQRPNPFVVGDLVTQKGHLAIYKFPPPPEHGDPGGVAIVSIVMEPEADGGDKSDDHQVNDMVIATITPGGELRQFPVESFRFQKYDGGVA